MIEDVKNILNKILENYDKFKFEVGQDIYVSNNAETVTHPVFYKHNDNSFAIHINDYRKDVIISKNGITISKIKPSDEDYLEISLLTTKIYNAYKDKAYNEFIHSFD